PWFFKCAGLLTNGEHRDRRSSESVEIKFIRLYWSDKSADLASRVLILLSFSNAFAQTDFSTFWKKFKSAIIAGDNVTIAEMKKLPLLMPYGLNAVKNKEDFSSRYNEIFKGEALKAVCIFQR